MVKIDTSKFINRFIDEADENIKKISENIFKLRERPDDIGIMDELMRFAHTIKGTSRMVKFQQIERLTHKLEDIFNGIKNKRIKVIDDLIEIITRCLDQLEKYLDNIRKDNNEGSENLEIIKNLELVLEGESIEKILKKRRNCYKKNSKY